MRIYVVIGHQREGSYCHAIAQVAMETLRELGHDVLFHDLYVERFDPVLPDEQIPENAKLSPEIQQHVDELGSADGIIVVHPNWWGQPPAILKGWVDRCLREGSAYNFTDKGPVGYYGDKTVLVFTTSNTPHDVEVAVYGDPLENLWKTVTFGLCGVEDFTRRNFDSIVMSTPQQRGEWLNEVREIVRQRFPSS